MFWKMKKKLGEFILSPISQSASKTTVIQIVYYWHIDVQINGKNLSIYTNICILVILM